MLDGADEHTGCVDAWLLRLAPVEGPAALIDLVDGLVTALWVKTATTLGVVTLTAIAERVLHNTAEKFPLFSSVTVDPTRGIRLRELHELVGDGHRGEVLAATRFLLIELLTVLGNLTAGILTRELHKEVERAPPRRPPAQPQATHKSTAARRKKKS